MRVSCRSAPPPRARTHNVQRRLLPDLVPNRLERAQALRDLAKLRILLPYNLLLLRPKLRVR